MHKFVMAVVAVPLLALPALAQTTATTPSTTPMAPTAPATTTGPMTTAPMATSPAGANHTAGTNSGIASDKMAASGGLAGANSFTEGQARSRLEKEGFSNVSGLAKDKDGVWRGKASKGAHEQTVGVDYKGNIVAN
jgi:hypothetical protein